MKELKPREKVSLTNGSNATVMKELGRGGQGIVYQVEVNGQQMALKWYLTKPNNAFYKAVYENIEAVGCIKEIEINKTYPMVSKFDWNRANRYFVNDMELGGYIE
jgi:hypothetical protein